MVQREAEAQSHRTKHALQGTCTNTLLRVEHQKHLSDLHKPGAPLLLLYADTTSVARLAVRSVLLLLSCGQ